MPRQIRTKRRHLHHAHRFAQILAILITTGAARLAVAAAPVYEGSFTSAGLCSPRGVDFSPSGDVFVGSDCHLQMHMEHFTSAGELVGTWAFPAGYFGSPNGVALDGSGNVYVTDYEGGRILKLTSSGALITSWGSLSGPVDLAVDGSGNIFVLELAGKRVQKYTANGSPLAMIGSAGTGPGQFQSPHGMGLDAGGRLYVADWSRKRILRFLADGSFDMEFATPVQPEDVAVGPDGNIYVIRFYTNGEYGQVYQYSPSGVLLQRFGAPTGMDGAFRIAITPSGTIFITVQLEDRVTKFQLDISTSAVSTTFGRIKALYR
jgi:DNA-binding beta-propeller fold protein YncE